MLLEPEKTLILGTAGHIDHGKTSLVYSLTGTNTDRLPAEKLRGITIDIGFASLQQDHLKIGVVDVPGHERFIRHMLAGAFGFDLAMLCVAADDGVMPQTREHFEILKILGIRSGLIAMTKCDLANADWQDMVEAEIGDLVAGSFLEGAPIIRVSAKTGMGLEVLKSAIFKLAQNDQTSLASGPFRLCIDRVFHREGHGVVVTGSVMSGSVYQGQNLDIWPGGGLVRVRSLQSHGSKVSSGVRGMRLAMNLAGVKLEELARGLELGSVGFLKESYWTAARIDLLNSAPVAVKQRGRYRLHAGTRELACTVIARSSSDLTVGSSATVLIKTQSPVTFTHNQPLVIRSESPQATLAGGKVVWPSAKWIRRRDQKNWDLLERLSSESDTERLEAWLSLSENSSPDVLTACRETGISESQLPAIIEHLKNSSGIISIAGDSAKEPIEISKLYADRLMERIEKRLRRFHDLNLRLTGVSVNQFISQMGDVKPNLVRALLSNALNEKKIVQSSSGLVALRGFSPQLTQAEFKLRERILADLVANRLAPPLLDEWVKTTGTKPSILLEILKILISEGLVEEIFGGLFLTRESANKVKIEVSEWFNSHETMTVAELRDLLGLSRKHAVPIAEWLDRQKLTVRVGDFRYLYKPENAHGSSGFIAPNTTCNEA